MADWRSLLYTALAADYGLVISTPDPDAVKQALYRERSKLSDSALGCLQLRTSPDDPTGEIWIIRSRINGKADPMP